MVGEGTTPTSRLLVVVLALVVGTAALLVSGGRATGVAVLPGSVAQLRGASGLRGRIAMTFGLTGSVSVARSSAGAVTRIRFGG